MPQTKDDEFNVLLEELVRRETTNQLAAYKPYPFQKAWHNAKGLDTDEPARQKALMCANKIGKTFAGVFECVIHATGLYPAWWDGMRFSGAVKVLMAGVSADLVRDSLQADLLGDPHDEDAWGTGALPLELIVGKPIKKQGYTDAVDSIAVHHVSGGTSRIKFLAYEQGPQKFYARGYHVVEFDEEPPPAIYSQGLRSVIATAGIINITFTSEEGITEVVDNYMNELRPGQAFITASWDDAPHISDNPAHQEQLLNAIPPHERDMRTKGIPKMGSGMIFPVLDELLKVEPFDIPIYWPRIAAIDFGGFDHPFAAVWMALDRDNDTIYVYKTYKNMGALPIHTDALMRNDCDWIPTAWPHDVSHKDRKSGRPISAMMRDDYEINMLDSCFSNPPAVGQKEGQGGQGVEAGLWAMLTAMETGRFKVFETETEWFREKGIYHRKDQAVIKRMDDLMDASRYAYQSQRFADVRPRMVARQVYVPRGMRNW